MIKRGGCEKDMLFLCIHSQNPKRPDRPSKKERFANREKFMKGLIEKKVPLKSIFSVGNDETGKAWCVWEADTLERLKGIMDAMPYVHTEIIPVERWPQVM
jgi:hypothetical protein